MTLTAPTPGPVPALAPVPTTVVAPTGDPRTVTQHDLSRVGGLPALPERTLAPEELRRLVEALAARPELWQELAAGDAGQRHYASLHRDAHLDVWALFWNVEDDTGWHDHDTSSGAVAVARGELEESHLRIPGPHSLRRLAEGASIQFGPDYIHRITGGVDGAVSIHAYSPPLWRLGQYSIDEHGVLHRITVSYAEELRPR